MQRTSRTVTVLALLCLFAGVAAAGTAERIEGIVAQLCDSSLAGRGVGGEGLDHAASILAAELDDAGLLPAGDNGCWFQSFTPAAPLLEDAVRMPEGVSWGGFQLKNVIGMVPGTGEGTVIVGAHYDHLGLDPDGKPFPGADDNASGVAILCAVAAELAREEPRHRRAILFIVFSGEECGLLGSRWYVEHPVRSLETTTAMVNLDTVGRLADRRLFALAASSGAELPEMLRGVNLGFGFDLAIPDKAPLGSDQISFIERGVPALHLFTGPNLDYHRISDTPGKLDLAGMEEIAAFTAEVVRFLADREQPIRFVPPAAESPQADGSDTVRVARRVSLGTTPDFAFEGEGVRVAAVRPSSPAEAAGIREGDRIVAVDADPVAGLEDYSAALKAHARGDTVTIDLLRDGERLSVRATLEERK